MADNNKCVFVTHATWPSRVCCGSARCVLHASAGTRLMEQAYSKVSEGEGRGRGQWPQCWLEGAAGKCAHFFVQSKSLGWPGFIGQAHLWEKDATTCHTQHSEGFPWWFIDTMFTLSLPDSRPFINLTTLPFHCYSGLIPRPALCHLTSVSDVIYFYPFSFNTQVPSIFASSPLLSTVAWGLRSVVSKLL